MLQRLNLALHRCQAWLQSRLKRKIFAVVTCLTVFASAAVLIIAWAATELAADAFINHRLSQLVTTYQPLNAHALPAYLQRFEANNLSSLQPQQSVNLRNAPLGISEYPEQGLHILVEPAQNGVAKRFWLYWPAQDKAIGPQDKYIRYYVYAMAALIIVFGWALASVLTRLVVTPVTKLQQQVAKASPECPPAPWPRHDELGALNQAYIENYQRIHRFIEREKQFTRFVSHELRTPINVIAGATELYQLRHQTPADQALAERLNRANRQMLGLITTFLHLGREQGQSQDKLPLEAVLQQQWQDLLPLLNANQPSINNKIKVQKQLNSQLQVDEHFASVILHNLLRNSISHCQQSITLVLNGHRLLIINDLNNAPSNGNGFGHGLDIVTAVCQHAGWKFHQKRTQQEFYSLVYF